MFLSPNSSLVSDAAKFYWRGCQCKTGQQKVSTETQIVLISVRQSEVQLMIDTAARTCIHNKRYTILSFRRKISKVCNANNMMRIFLRIGGFINAQKDNGQSQICCLGSLPKPRSKIHKRWLARQ
eukprot:scaffold591082_cov37-Prasinocladus_malaysianus.AAC.1